MKKLKDYSVIIFDFDGVIIESMKVRDFGFRETLKNYPKEKVEVLIKYHNINGGLSRFHKFKYFFQNILEENVSEEKIEEMATIFSDIMKSELIKKKYLIEETVEFIKNLNGKALYIASGSENNELNYLCEKLGIKDYFLSINGSPTHKNEIVDNIIKLNNYQRENVALVGDSINDYEAAKINGIDFFGYNNKSLKELSKSYINNFNNY